MVVRRNRIINYAYDAQRMYKDWMAETALQSRVTKRLQTDYTTTTIVH